jgi:membrane protease YdiL (CAAX protease family)
MPPQQAPYGTPPQQAPYWVPGGSQFGMVPFGAPLVPRTMAAPPGVPFHRLGRTGLHRWWRPLLGTGFLLLVGLVVTTGVLVGWEILHTLVTGEFAEPQEDRIFPNPVEDLAVTLVILGVLIPVVLLTVWLVQRRPVGSVISVLNRVRWRWLLWCCLPGLGYVVVSYGLGLLVEAVFPTDETGSDTWVGWGEFVVPALIIVLLVPFQSAAEEFVFRGWLLQAVGSYAPDRTDGAGMARVVREALRSPWPAVLVTSVLFVAAHGYTGWAMADIFLFAMLIGWLTVRTGGLEAAITLHTVNNLVAFLLPAAVGELEGWSEQGGAPWTILLVDIPALGCYAVALLWLAGRNRVDRVTPAVPGVTDDRLPLPR